MLVLLYTIPIVLSIVLVCIFNKTYQYKAARVAGAGPMRAGLEARCKSK